jgi:hypothetical protein
MSQPKNEKTQTMRIIESTNLAMRHIGLMKSRTLKTLAQSEWQG